MMRNSQGPAGLGLQVATPPAAVPTAGPTPVHHPVAPSPAADDPNARQTSDQSLAIQMDFLRSLRARLPSGTLPPRPPSTGPRGQHQPVHPGTLGAPDVQHAPMTMPMLQPRADTNVPLNPIGDEAPNNETASGTGANSAKRARKESPQSDAVPVAKKRGRPLIDESTGK